jgi:hypothetical protein
MLITAIIFTLLVALWGCSDALYRVMAKALLDLRSARGRSSSPPARRVQSMPRAGRTPSLPGPRA